MIYTFLYVKCFRQLYSIAKKTPMKSIISFGFIFLLVTMGLHAQTTVGSCNGNTITVSDGECKSGFLEFVVTVSGTTSASSGAVQVGIPITKTVTTMPNVGPTPSGNLNLFNVFGNTSAMTPMQTTFKISGCDPVNVTFANANGNCAATTFVPQTITFGSAPVPTLSQWALIILTLCFLSIGVLAVRASRESQTEKINF